jgi:hypothetical protein
MPSRPASWFSEGPGRKSVDEHAVSRQGRGLVDTCPKLASHPAIQPTWTGSWDWALIAGRSIVHVRGEVGRRAEEDVRRLALRTKTDRFTVVELIGFSLWRRV